MSLVAYAVLGLATFDVVAKLYTRGATIKDGYGYPGVSLPPARADAFATLYFGRHDSIVATVRHCAAGALAVVSVFFVAFLRRARRRLSRCLLLTVAWGATAASFFLPTKLYIVLYHPM